MKEQPLDPRLEKLVAGLYGELSDDEMRELETLLERDEALRAQWEEMNQARAMLSHLDLDEPAPSFVFLGREPVRRRAVGGGILGRVRGWLDALGPGPAWATAMAALAVAVLAWSGLRVDRVDGGIALRFGGTRDPATQGPVAPFGNLAGVPEGGTVPGLTPTTVPYVTRGDMDGYQSQVFQSVSALLNDYGRYRQEEQTAMMQALYQEILARQDDAYQDLRSRIDAVNLGLLYERTRSGAGPDGTMGVPPAETTPVSDSKENRQ